MREPVAGATFRCSLRTKRVRVMVSTLISSMGRGGADSAMVRDHASPMNANAAVLLSQGQLESRTDGSS